MIILLKRFVSECRFYSELYIVLWVFQLICAVMFALGRLPGWVAQWKEMRENNEPIGRPRQIYTGYTKRIFSDIER